MGSIKMFAALFGPEKFKDNVRAVNELKGIAARYGKSLPQLALRWAISNHGGQHRARRLPHGRRGRGQRRRDRLVDQRRRPRRDRRDLRAPRGGHDARLLDRRRGVTLRSELAGKVAIVTGGAGGLGRGIVERFVEEGAERRHRRCGSRGAAKALASELGPRDCVQADRRRAKPTRSRTSSTSPSSDSAGSTSCATTPGIGGIVQAVPRRRLRRLRSRDGREHLRRDGGEPARGAAHGGARRRGRSSTPPRSAGSTRARA